MEMRNLDNTQLAPREPSTQAEQKLQKMTTGFGTKVLNFLGLGSKEQPVLKIHTPVVEPGSGQYEVVQANDYLDFSQWDIIATKEKITVLAKKGAELGHRTFETPTAQKEVIAALRSVHALWSYAKRGDQNGFNSIIKVMLSQREPRSPASEIKKYLFDLERNLIENKRLADEQAVLKGRSDSRHALAEKLRREAAEGKRTAGQHPTVVPKHPQAHKPAPRAQTPDHLGDGMEVISSEK